MVLETALPRPPRPLSRRSLLPRPHWLRGAGFLGAAILAFSMASAGAPPEAFCAGLRGLGPSSSLWENPAWGYRALRWLLFVPLKMENPRRGTGLGILPPFPGSPPCFRFGVTAPSPGVGSPYSLTATLLSRAAAAYNGLRLTCEVFISYRQLLSTFLPGMLPYSLRFPLSSTLVTDSSTLLWTEFFF